MQLFRIQRPQHRHCLFILSIIRDNHGYLCLLWMSMAELWISIFGYEYLEFTKILDIHDSVMKTIMDIIVQLWISIFAN